MDSESLLREVANRFAQLQRDGVSCCGTTTTQCTLLTELGRHGPMTLADLGRRAGLDKGWISRAVESLVQEGLLTKVPSSEDRRTVIISLTPAGALRYQELNRTLNEQSERVLKRIPAGERESVMRALSLLTEALRAESASEPVLINLEEEGF